MLIFIGCVKQVKEPVVTYDYNSTISYKLDTNYTIAFPKSHIYNTRQSIVDNNEMMKLFYKVKMLILKLKKRDAIISAYEDRSYECQKK